MMGKVWNALCEESDFDPLCWIEGNQNIENFYTLHVHNFIYNNQNLLITKYK